MRLSLALGLLLASLPVAAAGGSSLADSDTTVSEGAADAVEKSKEAMKKASDSISDIMGQSSNKAGDLAAFISALLFNGACTAAFLAAFSLLRLRFPRVYSNNALTGKAPEQPGRCILAWAMASFRVSSKEAVQSAGLDAAMFLEFCNLCIRISAVLTVPLVFVMCPLHYYFGGGAAGEDRLSHLDMGNIVRGHQWLYYVHAVIVWGVCIFVQRSVCGAQAKFLSLRFQWLADLQPPRANTVLVEQIPPDYRSDERLREFFARTFSPEAIKDARVVKRTGALPKLIATRELEQRRLHEAEVLRERGEELPRQASRCWRRPRQDPEMEAAKSVAELTRQIDEERERVQREAAAGPGGRANAASGFVTFASRHEAEMALGLRYSANRGAWLVSVAPDAETMRWNDLTVGKWRITAGRLLGTGIVVAIYIFFMPICAIITNAAKLVPEKYLGPLQPVWAGLVPTIGLQIMLSMMPTILLLLFDKLFVLKAEVWSQHQLQIWYFVFLLVFVVLVSALSSSLLTSLKSLVEEPFTIFDLLANNLPGSTHFFLNYIALQWAGHAMSMLRHSNLVKYLLWRSLYNEEEARELAEPEDQAFQGFGSRYARLMIVMTICIVFSTLTPLIAPLTLVFFALCRLIYGYLLVFTETRKSDLGGAYWVTQLKHVQFATAIYCALMIGILRGRAPNGIPAIIAAPALLFMLVTYVHFNTSYDWTVLPFDEIHKISEGGEKNDAQAHQEAYIQPELMDEAVATSAGGSA